jgi:hypothetical protein
MFCRFCGNNILDDSEFCPYCGKPLGPESNEQRVRTVNNFNVMQALDQDRKALSKGLINGAKALCYVSLVVFLICLIKMAPGFGTIHIVSYIAIAAVAIGLVILFSKLEPKALKNYNRNFYLISIIIASFILILSLALRIVYETKVDSAVADVPNAGNVYVRVNLDEEFYSSDSGYVKNPKSHIKIGDKWYDDDSVAYIALNKSYSLRVGTGYDYEGGYIDTTITFEPESLRKGYTQIEDVQVTPSVIGEVTMKFTRELDFWSVIFY